jgi:hypothetical protein
MELVWRLQNQGEEPCGTKEGGKMQVDLEAGEIWQN